MKKIILFAGLLVFISNFNYGQCLEDRHSATWYDGWMSCQTATNPNPERPISHFIQYDLQKQYYIYEIQVWNMNAPDVTSYGLKNVIVDYSTDGSSWTKLSLFTLAEAPGENDFEGIEEIDFGGIIARYILITAVDNYGGSCFALSEIRIRARNICNGGIVTWIANDGDWNVPSNWCGNVIPTAQDSVWLPPNKIITIPSGYTAESLWIDVGKNTKLEVLGDLNVFGN